MAGPIRPREQEDQNQSYESGDTDEQRAAHEAYGDNAEPVEGPREDYDEEAAREEAERESAGREEAAREAAERESAGRKSAGQERGSRPGEEPRPST